MTQPTRVWGMLLIVGALPVWLFLDNVWLALAMASVGVFLLLSAGAFDTIPTRPARADGTAITPEEIKEYRRAHPGTTIAEAIDAMKRGG